MRSLYPATTDDRDKMTAAIDHLRAARNLLNAPRAACRGSSGLGQHRGGAGGGRGDHLARHRTWRTAHA